jgi:hypothetical protein
MDVDAGELLPSMLPIGKPAAAQPPAPLLDDMDLEDDDNRRGSRRLRRANPQRRQRRRVHPLARSPLQNRRCRRRRARPTERHRLP